MGVYIKSMEMPTNCDNCWALDEYGDYPRCRITEEQRGYNFPIREKRMDDCPFVSVPPHGRLIDADALKTKRKWTDDFYETEYVEVEDIDDAPAILEAED